MLNNNTAYYLIDTAAGKAVLDISQTECTIDQVPKVGDTITVKETNELYKVKLAIFDSNTGYFIIYGNKIAEEDNTI